MEVLAETKGGIGWITLNRPKALNALSYGMVTEIEKLLLAWKEQEDIAVVCLQGAGEKAFCAGGDIRSLYDRRDDRIVEFASPYFQTEYRMDELIYHYPKPILVFMDGLVMGGGVGISYGASHRIITEKTRWAMPEMTIGFFPDVGASYFLNQMPGVYGRYFALTAETILPPDILLVGAADYYVQHEKVEKLKQELQTIDWKSKEPLALVDGLLERYGEKGPIDSSLEQREAQINQHFSKETVEGIVESLARAAESGDDWAKAQLNTLQDKSPTSLKVTLEQLKRGQGKSLSDCFGMEWKMALNFMQNHDFFEGVRALLVDKDRQPHWKPATLEEVTEEMVAGYFK
ncbi:enoyl-CoA hydratase/isomerase family protein [Ammoniphilus sp. YIM 78166]|uniref:enoyl-CoA hydratase/isomerase family protein n=1 Tax=Ammoniphilus sp. YIM 78166 TaxID=1644106 RepID=UPI00106F6207|nr:enoyl-CoA hydratase/isomerase family protein [Ammoniphilus sp. YIM 78166]